MIYKLKHFNEINDLLLLYNHVINKVEIVGYISQINIYDDFSILFLFIVSIDIYDTTGCITCIYNNNNNEKNKNEKNKFIIGDLYCIKGKIKYSIKYNKMYLLL